MNQMTLYQLTTPLCILASLLTVQHASAQPKHPNILFILIDDMGWKDIGCAGSSYYETPHIDRLATEGRRFENAYSAAPVCAPSRGAIYTGKYPARTKFTTVFAGNAGPDDRLFDRSKYQGEKDQNLEAKHRHALPKTETILATPFAQDGYRTGFFGKWHCGECVGYFPDQRGFHVAKGYRTKKVGSSTSGHWMKTFHAYAANLEGADRDAYVADVLTDECIDFITENKGKPWLAVLSHYLVHSPIQPEPEKLKRYQNIPTTDQNNPGYASMVESVDDSVGKVLATLKELSLEENTLIIFTSDNGGLTPKYTSNYPLMGGKSFPFEAGMKVPFIIKWGKRIEPGTSQERIIGMDIYPTMLSAAGLPLRPEQHADGVNLMPLLTENAQLKKRPLIFHYPHYTHATGPFSSIIADGWKLIRFYNDEKGAHLLYNLNVDPEEQNDLAAENSELRNMLDHQLQQALQSMEAEMPTRNSKTYQKKKGRRMHLEFTKGMAEKEHQAFEKRLGK